jgi:hypothetical protein
MLTFQLSCSVQTPFPSMPQTLMLKPVRREDEVQANNVLLVDTARGESLAIKIIGCVSHQIIVGGVYWVFLVHGQRVRSTGSKARRRALVGDVSKVRVSSTPPRQSLVGRPVVAVYKQQLNRPSLLFPLTMSFLDELRKIPPVTRFLCLATVGVSVPVMAKIVSPYAVLFVREYVTQHYQLWRVPTSFFLASEHRLPNDRCII